MSIPYTLRSIKSDADIIAFASLDFRGQRWEVLQAYYCNLFDIWENESDLSIESNQRLCDQRWAVEDYATERYPRCEFGRHFFASQSNDSWLAVHDGKALTGALFT